MIAIWNLLSRKAKWFLVISTILIIVFGILLARIAYFKNQWINEKFAYIKELEEKIVSIELKQNETVNDSKNRATKSINNVKNINDKLKKDENTIDNTIVPDSELHEYITELERESRD